jgi:hypothetical protein
MKTIYVIALFAGILCAMAFIYSVRADKPYYSRGDHIIKLVVKFDSDCWDEIYARATPKNNNHVLLNYQYVDNNDKPDSGPSEVLKLQWKFKEKKMDQTQATNENKIRTYVSIELVGEIPGETVTKYLTFNTGKRTIDFGIFLLHTDKSRCAK